MVGKLSIEQERKSIRALSYFSERGKVSIESEASTYLVLNQSYRPMALNVKSSLGNSEMLKKVITT